MAVKMDRMGDRNLRLDDKVHPLVRVGKLVHRFLGLKRRVALVDLEKRGLGPFHKHAVDTDLPLEDCARGEDRDGHVRIVGGGVDDGLRDVRDEVRQGNVVARVGLVPGGGDRVRGAAAGVPDDGADVVWVSIGGAG